MAKIRFVEWSARNKLKLSNAYRVLFRRFLKQDHLKKYFEKRDRIVQNWYIDEDVKPIKLKGRWELVKK